MGYVGDDPRPYHLWGWSWITLVSHPSELLTSERLCQSINLRFHHLIIGENWHALSLQGISWDMHRAFGWIISAVIYQVIGHGGHRCLCSVLWVHY